MMPLKYIAICFCFILIINGKSLDDDVSLVFKKSFNLFSRINSSDLEIKLGQVGGIAPSNENKDYLYIFHRGSREWNARSFPDNFHFDQETFGVILQNTILLVDMRNGEILDEWGNNTFFMPHGLSIDNQSNLWLTDVAMHQVFKYNGKERLLTLGEEFVPGSDSSHFCKPTDVILSNDGSTIYVADGYCNSRIVKCDSQGKFLKEYQMPFGEIPLRVPHSLVLIESLDLLCVADRENGRVVCFDTQSSNEGRVKHIIEYPSMKTVYAIAYHPDQHRLYAVSGRNGFDQAMGYTFSVDPLLFGDLLAIWKPEDKFGEPHDLTVSVDGRSLFVGEIRPNGIDVFDLIN